MNLLALTGVAVTFPARRRGGQPARAVDGVDLDIADGEVVALVGESGSGKSVTSLTLMRLLAKTANAQVSGQTAFVTREGKTVDLLQISEREMRDLRGRS